MTETRTCPISGEQLPDDRYVSRTATSTLSRLLADLPDLMADLEAALTKQVRFAPPTGGGSSSTVALPFGYAASEAGWVARQTILVWVDWIAAVRGHATPARWSFIGQYLRSSLEWVARHPDGPQIVDELIAALRNARRAIDRPVERKFAGTCLAETTVDETTLVDQAPVEVTIVCTTALYALTGAVDVTCPTCGTVWLVQARRDRLLERLKDVALTATELSRAVDGLGVDVTPERVRKWASRGLIAAIPTRLGGAPVYRVGDALDIVNGQTGCAIAG